MMKNFFKLFLLVSTLLISVVLLGMTGRGLSGSYLIIFFLSLLIIFLVLLLTRDREILNYVFFDKFLLAIEILFVEVVVLAWVSIGDFFFIELLKDLGFDFKDNTYWIVLFGSILPVIFASIAIIYFVGSYHFSNTIRILTFSAYIANSNLNDFLYYFLLKEPLPGVLTWLSQPTFLFGNQVTSEHLFYWMLLCVVMGFVLFLLPFEALTPDYFDESYDEQKSTTKNLLRFLVVVVFVALNASGIYATVPKIRSSVQLYQNYSKNVPLPMEATVIQGKNIVGSQQQVRLLLMDAIIKHLNELYLENNEYPISSGNCMNQWDSSYSGLPFSLDDSNLTDPEQTKSKKCNFEEGSKNILYYSDGKRFSLLLSGDGFPDNFSNIFIPGIRDVFWFRDTDRFYEDWKWKDRMVVFMYQEGIPVTSFAENQN